MTAFTVGSTVYVPADGFGAWWVWNDGGPEPAIRIEGDDRTAHGWRQAVAFGWFIPHDAQ